MKKTFTILALSLLVTGCSSSSKEEVIITSLKDGDKTVIKLDDFEISNNDIYKYIANNYGSTQILSDAVTYICDKEVTDQDKIDENLKLIIKDYEEYLDTDLDKYAKEQGFKDLDEYAQKMLLPQVKSDLLKQQYIEDNFKDLVKEYQVRFLKTVSFDSESKALEAIKSCKSIGDFDTLVKENKGSDLGMVTTESGIDAAIKGSFDKFTKDGIYSKAIKTTDGKYAIVYTYNSDVEKNKETISTGLLSVAPITSQCEAAYLKKYEFNVYEPKLKSDIEAIDSTYLG